MIESIPSVTSEITGVNAYAALALKSAGMMANINAAAQDFEAMFATQMLQPMFDTVPVNSLFGGGNGEQVMRSFMLQEYGRIIAKTGLLGIASQVKAEMLRAQEGTRAKNAKSPLPKAAEASDENSLTQGAVHGARG